jgi:large subunit ribosomal protein L15
MLKLNDLRPAPGSRRGEKRVGRGDGSGHGTYSGRGGKGQTARAGFRMPPAFEGGQTPLWKRIPKRGFKNPRRRQYSYVNLDVLAERFEDGAEITPEEMLRRGLIKEIRDGVKVLGRGECHKALTVKAHSFSKKALRKIEEAGGKAIVLRGKRCRPVESAEAPSEPAQAQEQSDHPGDEGAEP